MLGSTDGSLTVINYKSQPEVDIINYVNITSSIIIKPLFNETSFVISLANFNTLAADDQRNAIIISAGVLQIIGATVNSATTKSPLNTIFQVNNAQLFFYNVSVFGDVGDIYLVNINASLTSPKFTYSGGNYSESSFLFNLLAGTHSLSKLEFNNIKASDVLFNLDQSTLTIDRVNVKGGNALFLSLSGSSTYFTATNINFREYSGNFLTANRIQYISLSSINFTDLDLVNSTPFISVQGPIQNSVYLYNVLFQNITVKYSLMLFQNPTTAPTSLGISIKSVTVDTIKKKSVSALQKTNKDLDLQSIWPPGGICLLAQNAYLSMNACNLLNISSHCLALKDSGLSLANAIFNNSALDIDSTIQEASNADDHTNGVSWIIFDGGTENYNDAIIDSCQFIENKIPPNFGGALRFTGSFPFNCWTSNNKFINNRALYGGALYSDNPFLYMGPAADTFINNTARYGGAIYKTSMINTKYPLDQNSTLNIITSTFLENKASIKGGSIFLHKENLVVYNSIFNGSQAPYGGALYYAGTQTFSSEDIKFENVTFNSNSAQNIGAAMILFIPRGLANNLTKNTNLENKDILAGKISYSRFSFYEILPNQDEIKNDDNLHEWTANRSKTHLIRSFDTSENLTYVLNHKSGNPLNQIIAIEIFSEDGYFADFVNDGGVNIDIVTTQNDVSTLQAYLYTNPVQILFQNGTIYIKNRLIIFGRPRTTATLRFRGFNTDSGFLSDNDFVLNQTIQVYFEDCELGETYNPTTTACTKCPQGSYSFSDPYKHPFCTPCNNQLAFCLGGSEIAPRPGFWRYNLTSDKILECPINQACAGGYINSTYVQQGECDFPYEGNLCNQCVTGYAKDSNSKKCVNCRGNIFYYAKAAVFFIAQIIMALFALKSYASSLKTTSVPLQTDSSLQTQFDQHEAFNSSLLRIAFTYLQIFEIIAQFNISWPDWVRDTIAYINGVSPGGQGGFSPNCILKLFRDNDQDVYFIQLVITLIKPFLAWISLVSVYLLYLMCTRKLSQSYQELKKNIKTLFLIPAYMCQPSIIKATFILFRCENFSSDEAPVYFMLDETEVQCWTKFHILWSVVIGLPNLILWTVLFPVLLFKTISKDVNEKKDSSQKKLEYSFVYTGLKHERFYWELVIMLRKVLFIIILVFLNMISDKTQVFAIFGLLYIFVYIQYKFWPYEDHRLNLLELCSLLCLTTVAYSGISLLLEGNAWLNDVLVISALVLNLVFLLTLAFYFIKSYKEITKRNIQKIIKSYRNKQNDSKDLTDSKSPKSASNPLKLQKSPFSKPKELPSCLSSDPAETPKAANEDRDLKFVNILSQFQEIEEDQLSPQL